MAIAYGYARFARPSHFEASACDGCEGAMSMQMGEGFLTCGIFRASNPERMSS